MGGDFRAVRKVSAMLYNNSNGIRKIMRHFADKVGDIKRALHGSTPKVFHEEFLDLRNDRGRRIFEKVMSSIFKDIIICVGKMFFPFRKKIIIEDKVVSSPAKYFGCIIQIRKAGSSAFNNLIRGVMRIDGDILHEAEYSKSILPA